MEENVALDSKKQKKFVRSIKGIKKLIKKNEGKVVVPKKDEDEKIPEKSFSMRLKGGKIHKKKKRQERGLVYLSHIPHGFYEHEMTEYFKQFGVVTNARVIKSKRTGKSKGCAFVEFMDPSVGQVVAETMNNYLMGKRLLKAAYIPPEKQRKAFRKNWNSQHNPSSIARALSKKNYNADKDEDGELKRAKKLLTRLHANQKRLKDLGVNYDFFTPVDVPEALLDKIVKKEEDTEEKEEKKDTKKVNKVVQNGKQKIAQTNGQVKKNDKKNKPAKKTNEKPQQKNDKINEPAKKVNGKPQPKKEEKVNKKVQQEKEKKLKDAGVKAPEFIKVGSGDESDSSVEFDSDEYEKMMADEDGSDISGDEASDDDDGNDSDDGSDDESEPEVIPAKKPKGKPKGSQIAKGKPLPKGPQIAKGKNLPKGPQKELQATKVPVVNKAQGKVNKNKNRRRPHKKGKKPQA